MSELFSSRRSLQERAAALSRITGFILFAISFTGGKRQEPAPPKPWHPPKSCIFTRNPIRATRSSVTAGKKIYMTRCVGCHGERGHGDGPDAGQLSVRPALLSSVAVQNQTDGALWWKISFGRRAMPGYGFRLSLKDRWNAINYLRTLRRE